MGSNFGQSNESKNTNSSLRGIMAGTRFWGLLIMVVGVALLRLIPHPPNFSPVAALALFGGYQFANRKLSFFLPLAALVLSDLALGFHNLVFLVYFCFLVIVGLGIWARSGKGFSMGKMMSMSVVGSVLFFLVTNFGVWMLGGYPKNLLGLMECYTLAIPFFWNTLIGDLFYTAGIFGLWIFLEKMLPALRLETNLAK